MSGLWVAVTAEFAGSTFSHRATGTRTVWNEARIVHHYGLLLDEAAGCVRRGLAVTLPVQLLPEEGESLSDYEKLREIQKIVHAPTSAAQAYNDIKEVLGR